MLSISSKVALAIGITLSVAAISSIFVTMVAAQNLISSSSGGGGSSQSTSQEQQPSPQQNNTTTSSVGQNNASIASTITIPAGATAQNAQHYQPNPATVAPSSRVTWDNKDSAPHTATAIDGSFDTGIIQPGATGSATVPAQRTIPYHCTIHPWMTATLQASSSPSAGSSSTSALQQKDNNTQQQPSPAPPSQSSTGASLQNQSQPQETQTANTTQSIMPASSNKVFYIFSEQVEGLNETTAKIPADIFSIPVIVVNDGDNVTVHFYNTENESGDPHTFTIDAQPYNVNIDTTPGESGNATFTANQEGTFPFYCKYHLPTMTGQLVVLPQSAAQQPSTQQSAPMQQQNNNTGVATSGAAQQQPAAQQPGGSPATTVGGMPSSGKPPSTDNFGLPDGYTIEPVVWNLTAPDSVTFDDKGNMYIAEAGYPFTGLPEVPRILKVESQTRNISVFANTGFNAPIVDIVFNENDGLIYVAHRDKISTIDANGSVKDIITGLPANGDHQVNQIAFSPDGKRLYFGIGTATNSGVVGGDDYVDLTWLSTFPFVHDVPGMNITLTGQNFEGVNPLTAENDTAVTGAFVPFNTRTTEGQVIEGDEKCSGCILSYNLNGTGQKLEGWGFRNPNGLAFNDEGRLFAAVHGADERGSRPIANDSDKFYEVRLNETTPPWHGWPDYFGNAEPVTDPKFKSSRSNQSLEFLMEDHPNVESPLALFEPAHTAIMQVAFADEQFGFAGEAFVPEMGTYAPGTEPPPPPSVIVGQDVRRVNVDTGNLTKFLTIKEPTASFRPTDILFRNESDGTTAMYLVDWGTLLFPGGITIENTGVVWKIMKTTTAAEEAPRPGATQGPANQTTTANATSSNMTSNATTGVPPGNATSAGPSANASAKASNTTSTITVLIVRGAANPGNQKFFEPPEIRVSTGATITWTNDDIIQHTVTAGTSKSGPSGQFDSGLIQPNGKFDHTFNSPGTIDYYCTLHPWMTGRVTVDSTS